MFPIRLHRTVNRPDRSKPLVRVPLCFIRQEVSLRLSLDTRFLIAFHPDGDVRRTSHARTAYAVHMHTERCTHVRRTTHVAAFARWQSRNDVSEATGKAFSLVPETFKTTLFANMKLNCHNVFIAFTIVLLSLLPLRTAATISQSTRFENIMLPYEANNVEQVFQDHNGLTWFITSRGVFTYDGYTVRRIIEGNFYAAVYAGKDIMVLGCDHGLRWLNLNTKTLAEDGPAMPVECDVRSLAIHNGSIFVGTKSHGLFSFDIKSKVWQRYTSSNDKNDIIYSIQPARKGLFISHLHGLAYIDAKGNTHDCGVRDNVYQTAYDQKRNLLWIGTEHGLLCRNLKSGNTVTALSGSTINNLLLLPSGKLILATELGLQIYNSADGSAETIHHDAYAPLSSLPSNRINSLLSDRQGNIWLATDHGVAFARATHYLEYTPLTDITQTGHGNRIEQVIVDHYGGIWLGGDNGIIHVVDNSVKWFRSGAGLRKNLIRRVYEDREHDIWIATDAGIARYDRSKDGFVYYDLTDGNDRGANWTYDIYEDDHGRLWIATYMGGLYVVDKKTLVVSRGGTTTIRDRFAKYDNLVNTIYRLVPDGRGCLWAYSSKGLIAIDTKSLKVSLKRKMFLDAMSMMGNTLWIDIQGKLYRYDTKKDVFVFSGFEVKDGMIYALVPGRDRLWISTSDGLYFAQGNSVHSYSNPEIPLLSGFYVADSKKILWGGVDVIAGQRLLSAQNNSSVPKVHVSELLMTDRENYKVYLSTYDYNNKEREIFWYKVGERGTWQTLPAGTNCITLSALKGGDYTIYMTVAPNHGKAVSSYHLQVPYPWYLRWYAITIYVVLALLVVLLIVRHYKLRAQREVERCNRENMLAMAEQKMEFFIDMSHELKTPLSLIIAPLESLISASTNAKLRAALKKILVKAKNLIIIIYRILDIKKTEAESDDKLLTSHVDITSVVRESIDEFKENAASRGITLACDIDGAPIWMDVDVVKIQMVLRDILSNAMKYVSDETGDVHVAVKPYEAGVYITVADNGPGVADNDLEKIFNRYYKGDNMHNGSGIGLSVVRKYVGLHGGKVTAKNDNGLVVTVSLPLAVKEDVLVDDDADSDNKPLVLIVDDNHEVVDFLSTALKEAYNTVAAYSGEEASTKVAEKVPDLIITDQMMPGMDGVELCKRLRQNHSTRDVPIIMLTAKDDISTEMASISGGADVFMPKPFNMRKLQLHIAQLLKRRNSIIKSVHIKNITEQQQPVTANHNSGEELMGNVVRLIDENMSLPDFSVLKLSDLVGIDQKQLYRKIKAMTGETPVNFIREQKLKKAAALLRTKTFSVSEVMYQVGFNSMSYFSNCFSKKYNMSPREFMEQQ